MERAWWRGVCDAMRCDEIRLALLVCCFGGPVRLKESWTRCVEYVGSVGCSRVAGNH